MPLLNFEHQTLTCRDDESVLDALLRRGINVPFSCRKGVCHVCLQHCSEGPIPAESQAGLRTSLIEGRHFLPCMCKPQADMRIGMPVRSELFQTAQVVGKTMLSEDVCRILLEPAAQLDYRAGQFINLRRDDGVIRSYSLAGLPNDYLLELHIQRMDNGVLSNWLIDALEVGSEIEFQGPEGDCVLPEGGRPRALLLVGSGSGLAPLVGIAREALAGGGEQEIRLVHAAKSASGHYLHDTLTQMQRNHPGLRYIACLAPDAVAVDGQGRVRGAVLDVALPDAASVAGCEMFIAGSPDFVERVRGRALELGVPAESIHADPFVMRDLRKSDRTADHSHTNQRSAAADRAAETDAGPKDPPSSPALWSALGEGPLLHDILADFYTRVFADERLAPFFHATTRQRSIEKQYLFLRQVFTGEKVFFGDRPRNAHHWMVISDELFDYRMRLLERCMRDHGLAEAFVAQWTGAEEFYRSQIVKSAPIPRVMNGVALPLDGFGEVTLDSGTLCDACAREVHAGEHVRYHLRLGTTYCSDCMGAAAPAVAA